MADTNVVWVIEQIHGNARIVVNATGSITITSTDGNPVDPNLVMPPQRFWDNLAAMIQSMAKQVQETAKKVQEAEKNVLAKAEVIAAQSLEIAKLVEQLTDMGKAEPQKKLVPVNTNKKQMFAAGVTFGRAMRK